MKLQLRNSFIKEDKNENEILNKKSVELPTHSHCENFELDTFRILKDIKLCGSLLTFK